MNRKLSDEQIDRLAEKLLRDFAADDETLDALARSPRLWWNVRSRIDAEKPRRAQSRFAAPRLPIFAFGALAILACGALAILFSNLAENSNSATAQRNPVRNPAETVKTPADPPKIDSGKPEISKNPVSEKAPDRSVEPKAELVAKKRRGENPTERTPNSSKSSTFEKVAEMKTDFIALSYAADSDGGQIVRVEVPSSLMVSLGLTTNVESEPKMVDAEVVVGDDGLARAIRFIR